MDISGMNETIAIRKIKGIDYYTFDLPMQGGVRKRLYGKTEEELKKKIEDYEIPEVPDGQTLGRLYSYFLGLNGYGMKQNRIYREAKDLLPAEFMEKPADECSEETINGMLKLMEGTGGYEKARTSMVDFCYWGRENGKIDFTIETSPSARYEDFLSEEKFLSFRSIALSDLSDLMLFATEDDSLKFRYASVAVFVAYMGLRIQDVLKVSGLEWKEDGKCLLMGLNFDLPIPGVLIPYAMKLEEFSDGEHLFGTLNRVTLSRTFDSYGKRLNLSGVTPVSVRKAFGRHLIGKGINLYTISRIMGDDVETIAKMYRDELTEDISTVLNEA